MVKEKKLEWVWRTVVKDSAHVVVFTHVSVSIEKRKFVSFWEEKGRSHSSFLPQKDTVVSEKQYKTQ
jgi:hypothetical protein